MCLKTYRNNTKLKFVSKAKRCKKMQKILLLFFVIVAKCCNASSNCYSVNKHVPFVHHFAAQTPYFPDNDVTKFNIHGNNICIYNCD